LGLQHGPTKRDRQRCYSRVLQEREATLAAWKALQDSERYGMHLAMKLHDVDCLQLAAALDGVAQSGPVVVAFWLGANAKKKVYPR
jgi:hypothetical protein